MTYKISTLALAIITTFSGAAVAAEPVAANAPTQALERRIDSLAQQLEALKAQLRQLQSQNEALAAQQEQQAQAAPAAAGAAPSALAGVSLWGYGEVNYERPIHDVDNTTADLARAVFGIGYRFDERTRFNSEYEIEHAVSSADDPGEVEVEQFWIDHQINDRFALKGGLLLIPSGLLNLSHEPTRYFGVHRNFVESLIIPTTWREGGIAAHGDTTAGFNWDLGVTTGFDLSKWEVNPSEALALEDAAPLQASHQELALANAAHPSEYLAIGYNGLPGLTVGASVFTGNAKKAVGPSGLSVADDQRVTLWEAHTRWAPGPFDLSALYARGTISHAAEFNALFPGASNPMPSAFFGYYLQGGVDVWRRGEQRLTPFVRWERINIGARYDGIAPGTAVVLPGAATAADRVWSYGLNYYLNRHVVLKADYQSFEQNRNLERIDFGLGLDF